MDLSGLIEHRIDPAGFFVENHITEEMRTGEKLGVGSEPRHGTAYVGSWVK